MFLGEKFGWVGLFGNRAKIHKARAFFVTRGRHNMKARRLYSSTVDKKTGLLCDQIVVLTGKQSAPRYPDKMRRIKYRDKETGVLYVFITNDFNNNAMVIANLYKYRWQIELFFRWIKQHLKIKVFWGTSANAVKTQICIAICAYLLMAIIMDWQIRTGILSGYSPKVFDKN